MLVIPVIRAIQNGDLFVSLREGQGEREREKVRDLVNTLSFTVEIMKIHAFTLTHLHAS